jgi:hypothetical protein
VAVDPEHSPVADHLETVGEVFRAREPLLTKVTGPHKRCPSRRSLSPPSNKKRSAKWETYRRAGRRAERLAKNASHPPGRASRYASSSRPASRSLGHGSKCQRCILAAISGEGGEAGRDQRNLVDRCVGNFLEVAEQPARGDARVPGRVVARRPGRRARPPCSEYAERPWTADFRRYKTSYWWLRCAWGAQIRSRRRIADLQGDSCLCTPRGLRVAFRCRPREELRSGESERYVILFRNRPQLHVDKYEELIRRTEEPRAS